MVKLDKLDRQIITLRQGDGTITNAGIARQVDVSEETVGRRRNILFDDEYMKVVELPNPGKLGLRSEELIGIHGDVDKTDQTGESLAEFDEVNWVSITTGSVNIFAGATLRTSEDLSNFLRTKVSR